MVKLCGYCTRFRSITWEQIEIYDNTSQDTIKKPLENDMDIHHHVASDPKVTKLFFLIHKFPSQSKIAVTFRKSEQEVLAYIETHHRITRDELKKLLLWETILKKVDLDRTNLSQVNDTIKTELRKLHFYLLTQKDHTLQDMTSENSCWLRVSTINPITITINNQAQPSYNKTFEDINADYTIREIKKFYAEFAGVDQASTTLFLNGTILDDNATISATDIEDYGTIYVNTQYIPVSFTVTNNITQVSQEFKDTNLYSTIRYIKELYAQRAGIDIQKHTIDFYCHNTLLDDESSLENCTIKNDDTISVVITEKNNSLNAEKPLATIGMIALGYIFYRIAGKIKTKWSSKKQIS